MLARGLPVCYHKGYDNSWNQAGFNGGQITSDAGALLLREIDRCLGLIDAINACIADPRDPRYTIHDQRTMLSQRILAIAQGYEDLNDHQTLRNDQLFQVIIDNASYHRTKVVRQLLDDHSDHVFVIWLPPYSPELNLIEGLWGYLKRSALNNYFYGDVEPLETALHEAFTELQQHPETALSLAYKTSTNLRKIA